MLISRVLFTIVILQKLPYKPKGPHRCKNSTIITTTTTLLASMRAFSALLLKSTWPVVKQSQNLKILDGNLQY